MDEIVTFKVLAGQGLNKYTIEKVTYKTPQSLGVNRGVVALNLQRWDIKTFIQTQIKRLGALGYEYKGYTAFPYQHVDEWHRFEYTAPAITPALRKHLQKPRAL